MVKIAATRPMINQAKLLLFIGVPLSGHLNSSFASLKHHEQAIDMPKAAKFFFPTLFVSDVAGMTLQSWNRKISREDWQHRVRSRMNSTNCRNSPDLELR
jgi:hypothetical protein